MDEVEVRTFREVNLRGGTVVEAFPTVGMVSSIAATYMISVLKMDQVCALDSDEFPALSMVYARKPKFPARVYSYDAKKLATFLCEVPLPQKIHRQVARKLLSWATAHQCKRIISLEGLPLADEDAHGEPQVFGVGSTEEARADLDNAKIEQLESGMISGVSGVLLNEGRWAKFDTIALLAEAHPNFPDALSAAKLVKAVDDLLPDIEIDLKPLLTQAKELQEQMESLREQAKPVLQPTAPAIGMYR